MSAIQRSGKFDAGNEDFFFYCQRQIEDAYTVIDAIYWHERIIGVLELEILTAYAFPTKDYQVVVDVLQASQDRYAVALGHLKAAHK